MNQDIVYIVTGAREENGEDYFIVEVFRHKEDASALITQIGTGDRLANHEGFTFEIETWEVAEDI